MIAIEDTDVLEVSTPELDDVVRLEDRYGRAALTRPGPLAEQQARTAQERAERALLVRVPPDLAAERDAVVVDVARFAQVAQPDRSSACGRCRSASRRPTASRGTRRC